MSRKKAGKISCILLIVMGFMLAAYPLIAEKVHEQDQASQITSYEELQGDFQEQKIRELLTAAEAYNERLANAATVSADLPASADIFAEDEDGILPYADQLKLSDSSVMGIIRIPCIDLELPIYHGTSDAVLTRGVGHLEGSSLPVGGESTHSVLTGHTGLNTAKLFTDLCDVREGDKFYIEVLDRELVYEVTDITVTLPEETDALRIIRGEDLCTLVTCTPYGINSHRLLVTGRRVSESGTGSVQTAETETASDDDRESQWMSSYSRAILIGLLVTAVLFITASAVRRRRCRSSED